MKRNKLIKTLKKNIALYLELAQKTDIEDDISFFEGKASAYSHVLFLLEERTQYDNGLL